jgi:hypothetical protein
MLDLLSTTASVCCVTLWYCISLIGRRVKGVDGLPSSYVIFNQPRLYRRYWKLASDHDWSRIPVLLARAVTLCGLISGAGVAVLLISHTMR